jgi:hypothetical protein
VTAPQDLLAHGRMQREAAPPNPTVLRAAKRLQQAYDLRLPGAPELDLTVEASAWDELDAEAQGEWIDVARVALGVEP